MTAADNLARQAGAFLEWKKWKPGDLAAEVSRHSIKPVARQSVEALLAGGVEAPRYLPALALAMRTTVETLVAGGYVPPSDEARNPLAAGEDPKQGISLDGNTVQTIDPPRVAWESIVSAGSLPPMFVIQMPDGSLAGKFEKGVDLVLAIDVAPQVDRPVLVETVDGQRWIRNYAEGRDGSWRAIATSPSYLSFDSSTEPLKVLAAFKWSNR